MNCAQCGRKFTCGCQKASTADGRTVCKGSCKKNYENKVPFSPRKTTGSKTIRRNEILKKQKRARR